MGFLEIFSGIGGMISAPVTQYLKNSGEKSMAKHKRKLKVITGEQTWEERQAEASNGSWKDEYLTILITVPFIMTFGATFFGQAAEDAVARAVVSVSSLPPEYWYLMSATFAAAFAIKGIPAAVNKMRANKSTKETANGQSN